MTIEFNGDRWIAHFLCDVTRMSHLYNLPTKALSVQTIQGFTAFAAALIAGLQKKAISVEESAAHYTPAQNGAAERSGAVIIQKARILRELGLDYLKNSGKKLQKQLE
ncbi:hypothetical protein V1509DRAFT_642803 [Lipomyces kononenkoae]